jgi:2-keto-4-pentenoate hydratase/2-oxohepta-3-ene-1,7-dioic acid hydratase in catechol pathway
VDAQLGVFVTGMRKNISIETAHQFIFGYALFSRFSTRDRQMMNMSGLTARPRGRSFDTSNAIGPWIVTPDEISNRAALEACLRVNGEVCAASTIGKLRQSFAEMIASVSRNETIYPGEFLGIGTLGCGCGRGFDRLLKSGDTVEFEIPGVGILRNRIVPAAP